MPLLTLSEPPPAVVVLTVGAGETPRLFTRSAGRLPPASRPRKVIVNTPPATVTATLPWPTAGSDSRACWSPAAVRVATSSAAVVCGRAGVTWVAPVTGAGADG